MCTFPEVKVDFGDRKALGCIVRIDFPGRLGWDGDVYGGEISHGFGDVITVIELQIIGYVLEGLVKLCGIVLAGVVKRVEFNFLGLPSELPALVLSLAPAMTIAIFLFWASALLFSPPMAILGLFSSPMIN